MSDEVKKVNILKEIPFFGEDGDSLQSRLRKVTLRGFPEVRIYQGARFSTVFLTPDKIERSLHTPQPNVYQNILDRIGNLSRLFSAKGIDILNLEKAYDFESTDGSGNVSYWTMIPPIVERFHIPSKENGGLDYSSLVSPGLMSTLSLDGLGLNPELSNFRYNNDNGWYDLINDGSHRIHYGFLNRGVRILRVEGMAEGFPYYAVPQPYSAVKVFEKETGDMKETKVHIVESPGHKKLYRVFPSGGILSGGVRPPRDGEIIH